MLPQNVLLIRLTREISSLIKFWQRFASSIEKPSRALRKYNYWMRLSLCTALLLWVTVPRKIIASLQLTISKQLISFALVLCTTSWQCARTSKSSTWRDIIVRFVSIRLTEWQTPNEELWIWSTREEKHWSFQAVLWVRFQFHANIFQF